MRLICLLTMCVGWICSMPMARADDKPLPSGMLSYPLAHNLNLQEGTLEFWARLELDVQAHLPSRSFKLLTPILSITGDEGALSLRYMELGYDVTVVKDAVADYSDDMMRAALEINIPNYASAIVTTQEIVEALSAMNSAASAA